MLPASWNEQVQIQLGQESPPVSGHQDHTQLQLSGQTHGPRRDPGARVRPLWKTTKEADGLHFGAGPEPDERQRTERFSSRVRLDRSTSEHIKISPPLNLLSRTMLGSCLGPFSSASSGVPVQARLSSGSRSNLGRSRGGLASVARLVKLGRCKNVVVVAGAGISTASGIPDFRLPLRVRRCFSVAHSSRRCYFCIPQDSGNGPVCQPGAVQPPLPGGRLQHRLLFQRPAAVLLPGEGSVSRKPPAQLHPLLHPRAPPQRPAAAHVHAEHRRAGEA